MEFNLDNIQLMTQKSIFRIDGAICYFNCGLSRRVCKMRVTTAKKGTVRCKPST
jgi:hypothetical protein